MARSKIIVDLVNGVCDVNTALKRLTVLLFDFKNDDIKNWVNYELCGYGDECKIPEYRKIYGELYGTFLIRNVIHKNVPLPTNESDEFLMEYKSIKIYDPISFFCKSDFDKEFKISVPPELYGNIKQSTNIDSIIVADVRFGSSVKDKVISNVEKIALDILLELEKEYGNLDGYDIDVTTTSDIKRVEDIIFKIIYNDNSITIGDNNKLKNTTIASNKNDFLGE